MHNSSLLFSADGELFSVQRTELVEMPHERSDLRYEVECLDINHEQTIFLGVIETEVLSLSESSPGLAVAIEMGSGTLRDLVNETGVIGYFDDAPYARDRPLRIGVEMDVIGAVCIPKIVVGRESILHPALQLRRSGRLSALVGHTLTERSIRFGQASVKVTGRRDRASV